MNFQMDIGRFLPLPPAWEVPAPPEGGLLDLPESGLLVRSPYAVDWFGWGDGHFIVRPVDGERGPFVPDLDVRGAGIR